MRIPPPFLFFLPWALTLSVGHATSFAPQDFPKAVQDAPIIVRGKIGMSYADWGKDDNGIKTVYTYLELHVSEVFKGSPHGLSPPSFPHLMIREMGGEKDGIGVEVTGTSHYGRGEDVIVFLREKNGEGSFDVQGMMMGKYNLQKEADGTEFLVGAAFMPTSTPTDSHLTKKWTLDALRHLIQTQAVSMNLKGSPRSKTPPPESSTLPQAPQPPFNSRLESPVSGASPAPISSEEALTESNSFPVGLGLMLLSTVGLLTWITRQKTPTKK